MAALNGRAATLDSGLAFLTKSVDELFLQENFRAHELLHGSTKASTIQSIAEVVCAEALSGKKPMAQEIRKFIPLAEAMTRAGERVGKLNLSQLKRSLGHGPFISEFLFWLMSMAAALSNTVLKVCVRSTLFDKSTYGSQHKGTLYTLASLTSFSTACLALFKRVAAPPPSWSDVETHYNINSVVHMTRIVMEQMALFERSKDETSISPRALADLAPLEKQGVLGFDAALNSMEYVVSLIHSIPGGIEHPKMPSLAACGFLNSWVVVLMSNPDLLPTRFPRFLSRIGKAGMDIFIGSFHKSAKTLTSSRSDFASDADVKDLSALAVQCLSHTFPFWLSVSMLSSEEISSEHGRMVFGQLATPTAQQKMLEATTMLQTYSNRSMTVPVVAAKAGKSASEVSLKLQAVIVGSQASCCKIMLDQMEDHKHGVNSLSLLLHVAKWVTPATTTMAAMVYGIKDLLDAGIMPEKERLWNILSIASRRLHEDHSRELVLQSVHRLKCASPPKYTAEDINALLRCTTSLYELDFALSSLMTAYPQLWDEDDPNGCGPVPVLPQMLAIMMSPLVNEIMNWPADISECRAAAMAAVEAETKCRLVFSSLSPVAHVTLKKVIKRGSAIVDADKWPDEVMRGGKCQDFTALGRAVILETEGVDEEGRMAGAGLLLGQLYGFSSFAAMAGARYGINVNTDYGTSFLRDLMGAGDATDFILLPRDVPALDRITRFTSAADAERSSTGSKYTSAKMLVNRAKKTKENCRSNVQDQEAEISSMDREMAKVMKALVIAAASSDENINERRMRRAKALATRPCCNVKCKALPPNGKKLPKRCCSGCMAVHYCSEECQKKDWKEHKLVCKELKALKK